MKGGAAVVEQAAAQGYNGIGRSAAPLARNTWERTAMTQITARVPDELAEVLDAVAAQLKSSRAGVIRQALESYLEDFDDLTVGLHRLSDPSDPVLDWDQVKRELLSPN